MTVVKLHIRLPKPKRNEVYRWTLTKRLEELTLPEVHRRLILVTESAYKKFIVRWNDGHDMCLITNNPDLASAFQILQVMSSKDDCIHLHAEAIVDKDEAEADDAVVQPTSGRLKHGAKATPEVSASSRHKKKGELTEEEERFCISDDQSNSDEESVKIVEKTQRKKK